MAPDEKEQLTDCVEHQECISHDTIHSSKKLSLFKMWLAEVERGWR